jgi:tRNA pseudouridine synthase 10
MIAEICRRTGVCHRCALRYLGVREISAYEAEEHGDEATKRFPCIVCLGILQTPSIGAIIEQARQEFETVHHDRRFKVNVTLPVSASIVRDRAFAVYLATCIQPAPRVGEVISLREAFKWTLCIRLERSLGVYYHPESEFFCDVVFTHKETDHEARLLAPSPPRPRKRHRFERSRLEKQVGKPEAVDLQTGPSVVTLQRTIDDMNDEELADALGSAFMPPSRVEFCATPDVKVSVTAFVLAGTYNKWSRRISQTPWFLDLPNGGNDDGGVYGDPDLEAGREMRTDLNVEDVIVTGIKHVFRPDKTTFTAGGREDIDVRMLGGGRPFIVELTNPRVVASLVTAEMVSRALAHEHPGKDLVLVNDLRLVNRSFVSNMKVCEMDKRKNYRCIIWTSRTFSEAELSSLLEARNESGGFTLRQRTPLRVLHRRTLLTRERHLFQVKVVRVVTGHTFVLDVVAAAGTYIKEFVHGDNGRTTPNVGQMLGCDADILQLDVADIDLG